MDNEPKIKLHDVESVARFLNVKVSQIRSLVFMRKIPVVHIGKLMRFDERDLLEFIEGNKAKISDQ
jgi:excisionase family DNA binding protein